MSRTNHQRVNHHDAVMRKRALDRWENEGGKVLVAPTKSGSSTRGERNDEPALASGGTIKVHLRKLEQLFDSLDPAIFLASLIAGALGVLILWPKCRSER